MKTRFPTLICGALLLPCLLQAQPAAPLGPVNTSPAAATSYYAPKSLAPANPTLTKFDLDFPGGRPAKLVQAIEQASGKPLNAIVPLECTDLPLPALKMKNVDVAQLFDALRTVSEKKVAQITGTHQSMPGARQNQYSEIVTFYTFLPSKGAVINDDTIWSFHFEQPTPLPDSLEAAPTQLCRFYRLEPYLSTCGIDDITTALTTGYKLLGQSSPKMNYHKETKLLIVAGTQEQLSLIDSLLQRLAQADPGESPKPRAPRTVPTTKPPPRGEQ